MNDIKSVLNQDDGELRRPSRLAIFMSAFAFPGAGQYLQRRWFVATFFAVVFLVFFVLIMIEVFVPLMANLRIAMDFAGRGTGEPFRAISMTRVLLWFGLSMLVYVVSLFDTAAGYRRQLRKWSAQRERQMMP